MSKQRKETGDVFLTVCICVRSKINARMVTENEDDVSTRAWLQNEVGSNSSGLIWIREEKWSARYPAGGSVVGVLGAPGVGGVWILGRLVGVQGWRAGLGRDGGESAG